MLDPEFINSQETIDLRHLLFSNARHPYRLRGMATDHAYQKQGLGQRILKKALSELQKRNCDLLWFNARTSAEKFYAKLGFISSPEVFEISGAGPHKVMYKWL